MNLSEARAVGTIRGFKGLFRPVWAADWREVKEGGKTAYYPTPAEAECAAWRILNTIQQPVMNRDGDKLEAISKADAAFKLKPTIRKPHKSNAKRKARA